MPGLRVLEGWFAMPRSQVNRSYFRTKYACQCLLAVGNGLGFRRRGLEERKFCHQCFHFWTPKRWRARCWQTGGLRRQRIFAHCLAGQRDGAGEVTKDTCQSLARKHGHRYIASDRQLGPDQVPAPRKSVIAQRLSEQSQQYQHWREESKTARPGNRCAYFQEPLSCTADWR